MPRPPVGRWLRFRHRNGTPLNVSQIVVKHANRMDTTWNTQADPNHDGDQDLGIEGPIGLVCAVVTSDDTTDVSLTVYNEKREVVREEFCPTRCFVFVTWDFLTHPTKQPVVWDASENRSLMQVTNDEQEDLVPCSSANGLINLWIPIHQGRVDRLAAGVAHRWEPNGVLLTAGLRAEAALTTILGSTVFFVARWLPNLDSPPRVVLLSHVHDATKPLLEVALERHDSAATTTTIHHRMASSNSSCMQIPFSLPPGEVICHGFTYTAIGKAKRVLLSATLPYPSPCWLENHVTCAWIDDVQEGGPTLLQFGGGPGTKHLVLHEIRVYPYPMQASF